MVYNKSCKERLLLKKTKDKHREQGASREEKRLLKTTPRGRKHGREKNNWEKG